jgi:hypothetical protein
MLRLAWIDVGLGSQCLAQVGHFHYVPTLRRRTPVYVGLRAATCVDLRLRPATYVYTVMSVYVRLRLATRCRHGLSTRRLRMSTCVDSVDARRHTSVSFIMLFYRIGQFMYPVPQNWVRYVYICLHQSTCVYIGLCRSTYVDQGRPMSTNVDICRRAVSTWCRHT